MNYRQLTQDERDKIAVLRSRDKTWRDISQVLGRSHTTLSREWRRNGRGSQYYPHRAHAKAIKRRLNHTRMRLKTRVLHTEVEQMLMNGWSPEIIAGDLKRDNHGHTVISHESIYQWIYAEAR